MTEDLIEGKSYRLTFDTSLMSGVQAVSMVNDFNQSAGTIIDTYIGKKFRIDKCFFQESNSNYIDLYLTVISNPLPIAVVLLTLAILAGLTLSLLILTEVKEIVSSPLGGIFLIGIVAIVGYQLIKK